MDSVKVAEGGGEGGKFTSTVSLRPWVGKDQRLEPFLAFRTRYDQALEAQRLAPGAVETATLCWGGTPRDPLQSNKTSFTTRNPKDDPAPKKDDNDKRIIIRERERYVEKVEIKGDDDDDDGATLTVERVRLWVGTGDDGFTYMLLCSPDGKKTVVTKGADVPIPPV